MRNSLPSLQCSKCHLSFHEAKGHFHPAFSQRPLHSGSWEPWLSSPYGYPYNPISPLPGSCHFMAPVRLPVTTLLPGTMWGGSWLLNGFMYSALWNDSVRPSEEANALRGTHLEKGKMRGGSWDQGLLHSTACHGVQQQSPGKAAVNGRPGHSSTLAGIRVTAGRQSI